MNYLARLKALSQEKRQLDELTKLTKASSELFLSDVKQGRTETDKSPSVSFVTDHGIAFSENTKDDVMPSISRVAAEKPLPGELTEPTKGQPSEAAGATAAANSASDDPQHQLPDNATLSITDSNRNINYRADKDAPHLGQHNIASPTLQPTGKRWPSDDLKSFFDERVRILELDCKLPRPLAQANAFESTITELLAHGPSHLPDCFAPARRATSTRFDGGGLLMLGSSSPTSGPPMRTG